MANRALCRTANLFLLAMFVLIAAAVASPFSGPKHRAQLANLEITLQTGSDEAGCSATAIAPHAILTARHCSVGPDEVLVLHGLGSYVISKHIYDGNDGMILVVPGATFPDVFHLSAPFDTLEQGEPVFMFGNPGMVRDQYRTGVVMGATQLLNGMVPDVPVTLFSFATLPGDSGSLILTDDGHPLAVVTYGVFDGKFAGAYPLAFTRKQLQEVQ